MFWEETRDLTVPPAETPFDTIPKLLLRNAEVHASRPAFREKALGIWQSWTWAQVLDEVRALALGLQKLGLRRGDTLAIIGDNLAALAETLRNDPAVLYAEPNAVMVPLLTPNELKGIHGPPHLSARGRLAPRAPVTRAA